MSLRLKMILGIGTILLLVTLVYAILASSVQYSLLMKMASREADLMAAVVDADRALTQAMESGGTHTVQEIVTRVGAQHILAGIRILDPSGKILLSNRREETGRVIGSGEISRDARFATPIWNFQRRTVGIFWPILNRPDCARCHGTSPATLGFVNAEVSFPAADLGTSPHWTYMIAVGIAGLIAAGAMIWLFFSLIAGQRIDALSSTMRQVEAGDFAARVVDDSRDELGRLGRSFNTMVERLADARQQLEDRHAEEIRRVEDLVSLGKMAAGIAHEINNPLAGMLNCVRTLMKGTKSEEQRDQYLAMLREGLGRIGRTVGQLLDFAREAKPRLTPTDISSVLRRSLALLEHEMAACKISFSLFPEDQLPPLLADPHQMEEVFLNIFMNAVEAMPTGGTLRVTTNLRQRETGSFVEIRISDTGLGIPPENLPRIFDPFFTTKEVGKGTGLGLSVSFGIVKSHGGTIEVESTPGQGTTFLITLPVGKGEDNDEP